MIESEVYPATTHERLPDEIELEFVKSREGISDLSSLHWAEHCVECAMPQCYKTCDFYTPRKDGKCQRFVHGIQKIRLSNQTPLFKIQFKMWGNLETQGSHQLYPKKTTHKIEKIDELVAKSISIIKPQLLQNKFISKRYHHKKHRLRDEPSKLLTASPDSFMVEIYNPYDEKVYLNLSVISEDPKVKRAPFQYRLEVEHGYFCENIPFSEISKRVNINASYRISIVPDNISHEQPLYFGVLDFVTLKKEGQSTDNINPTKKKVKCVVWDLDNTIWDGVLIEDSIEDIRLKPGIREILESIESRGILNTIASKNNDESALNALEYFGIKDFFVNPQISWNPKSIGLQKIANDFNFSLDTVLFVDDSDFELAEVSNALPQIRAINAKNYQSILSLQEMLVPVTSESKKRKEFYLTEIDRKSTEIGFDGDYFHFLKQCDIVLEIVSLQKEHIPRIYELTQRTNQMNFSGNRYVMEDIDRIYNDSDLDAIVLKCRDKFGDYGIIGFSVIKKAENRLIDLMFSCRIQSKRVEHAFFTFVLNTYLSHDNFHVTYKPTEKNRFSAQVFYDFEFNTTEFDGQLKKLVFDKSKSIPDDGIIHIENNFN